MMAASKSPRARLLHIRDEIDGVSLIVRGLSFAQYQDSYMHRRAVERAVQIVSEAARALPSEFLAKYPNARGPPLSGSAISCGMNTSEWTTSSFGKSRRFTYRNCSRSWRKCLPTSAHNPICVNDFARRANQRRDLSTSCPAPLKKYSDFQKCQISLQPFSVPSH